MFNKILFYGKKDDYFSEKIKSELQKKSNHLKIIMSDNKNMKINYNVKYDFIFSFRSHHILKKKLLKNVNYGAINFHPGPPKYRGIGCVNYALYDNCKTYGVTAHLIDEKIDHGKIINIKIFRIKKKDSLDMVLQKAYSFQVKQAVQIIRSLSGDPNKLIKMVKNNRKIKWSKKIKNRNILNKFYEINKNISKNNLKKKIRATVTKKFKLYIKMHGIKFTYTN